MSEFYSLGKAWHMFSQMVNIYVSQPIRSLGIAPKQPETLVSEPGCVAMKFI